MRTGAGERSRRGAGGRRAEGVGALVCALAGLVLGVGCGDGSSSPGAPPLSLDLADPSATATGILRVRGSEGFGGFGVPVAGGGDVDGDGFVDLVLAAMLADPAGRTNAGEVFVILGDGTIAGEIDTAVASARVLRIQGAADQELAGSEVWVDDVTGDGVADVLIARQNFTPEAGRIGAGAVTILVGGAGLATAAASLTPIDLAAAPPSGVVITTLVGGQALGRFGIWLRTGDVTGDGVADLLVGADQENTNGEGHSGAVYLVRGGAALAAGGELDLASPSTALPGDVARVEPAAGSVEFHLGATCQLADLDGNGRAEVLAAATIERAGATLRAAGAPSGSAHGSAGAQDGALYVVWDDNFADPWPADFAFTLDGAPGAVSEIRGGVDNIAFGEEIQGGLDFDADGRADLFVGDIIGDLTRTRFLSGNGRLFYDAASLRGLPPFDLDAPPAGVVTTVFLGPAAGDLTSDTAFQGDFDGDGRPDLAFSSPHGSPYGRREAGKVHVIHGQVGLWPAVVDLRWGQQPDLAEVRISEIHGVKRGDVLAYSGTAGDVDGDGLDDLIVNEMLGDGVLPEDANTGNLLVVSGVLIRDLP